MPRNHISLSPLKELFLTVHHVHFKLFHAWINGYLKSYELLSVREITR